MDQERVQRSCGVTLVGAGYPRLEDIEDALKIAPHLIAADGGANHAINAGYAPEAVIGDLDSLSASARDQLANAPIVASSNQDTTDFEKSLAGIDAPFIIATGFTAGRVDHTLSVCSVLAKQVGPTTLVISQHDVLFAAGKNLSLNLVAETRVSLYPLTPVRGTSSGLEWPIDNLVLAPDGLGGVSNRATGAVSLTFDRAGVLVILPREELRAALAAVTAD